jgi:thiol-disulfide isomerase/thioredoxin
MSNQLSHAHTLAQKSATPSLLVACLCAQWCRTCDEYKPLFAQLKAEYPQAQFRWIDIEDEADLVDPIEVDNFPTLLIATDGEPRFFGFITPHLETLRRLIQAHLTDTEAAVQSLEVQALVQRLETSAT